MRASRARRSARERPAERAPEYVNTDPFGTLRAVRASRASSLPQSVSSEADTEDSVFSGEETDRTDYRGLETEQGGDSLAVTEELLELLEDFKKKYHDEINACKLTSHTSK